MNVSLPCPRSSGRHYLIINTLRVLMSLSHKSLLCNHSDCHRVIILVCLINEVSPFHSVFFFLYPEEYR